MNKDKKGINQRKSKDLMEDEKHTHTPIRYQRIMNYMIMSCSDGIIN